MAFCLKFKVMFFFLQVTVAVTTVLDTFQVTYEVMLIPYWMASLEELRYIIIYNEL